MKYTPLFVVFLFGLFAERASAQGWLWGVANGNAAIDGWGVATDKYGDVFCAGMRAGLTDAMFGTYTVPYTGGVANYQCVAAKYDPNGAFQWAVGNSSGEGILINIAADPSGNLLMFGAFDSGAIKFGNTTLTNTYKKGDFKYFLVKFDPFGNLAWATAAGNTQSSFIMAGGVCPTLGVGAIATDGAGNIYVTANFHRKSVTIGAYTLVNTDASGTTDDILLAKYDPTGVLVWATSVGGSLSDDAYAMTVTTAGDIYIAGDFASPSVTLGASVISNTPGIAGQTAFIARFDASGTAAWAYSSGGAGNEYASGLTSDRSNNVYLTGGIKENSITFNGATISNPYPGQYVCYLAKLDPANNVDWTKTIGSPVGGDVFGYSVAASNCGDVWVMGALPLSVEDSTGIVSGEVNVDGNIFTTPAGSYDPVFLAGYTASGNYVTCQMLQSGGDDQCGLACDPSGNVLTCGDYEGIAPPDVGGLNFAVDSTPQRELMYLAKYTPPLSNPNNFVHADTSICFISGMILSAPPGYAKYLWSDGRTTANRNITDTGLVWVRGDDTCGIYAVDTFHVNNSCNCLKYLFIPNSFTPNGDGKNDVFYPRSSHGETKINWFRIYDRWGELLFERDNIYANDATNAWDGSYKGNLPLPDVYVYMVEAVCEDGTVVNKKGSVTVIR